MKLKLFIGILTLIAVTQSMDPRMLGVMNYIKNHGQSPVVRPFFRTLADPSDYKPGQNKLENCPDDYIHKLCEGYPFEGHTITTEDGYILRAFRMQAKGTTIKNGLPPVFLQHGVTDSCHCFLTNDEDKALSKILANAGFDVWLGNTRGNKFSRRHKTLDIHSKAFWEFSFQQMGEYDVPGNLQYIAQVTGRKDIVYVGHSQGTSQMFAALSDPVVRPKVVPYLKSFYALAPVVFLVSILTLFYLSYISFFKITYSKIEKQ
jgi:hypothetical protein